MKVILQVKVVSEVPTIMQEDGMLLYLKRLEYMRFHSMYNIYGIGQKLLPCFIGSQIRTNEKNHLSISRFFSLLLHVSKLHQHREQAIKTFFQVEEQDRTRSFFLLVMKKLTYITLAPSSRQHSTPYMNYKAQHTRQHSFFPLSTYSTLCNAASFLRLSQHLSPLYLVHFYVVFSCSSNNLSGIFPFMLKVLFYVYVKYLKFTL